MKEGKKKGYVEKIEGGARLEEREESGVRGQRGEENEAESCLYRGPLRFRGERVRGRRRRSRVKVG